MKIGLYLAYGPNVILTKEGLGRYVGSLICGLQEAGHQVAIACPDWSLGAVDEMLSELRADKGSIQFIVSHKKPALWQIYEGMRSKKRKKLFSEWKLYREICGLGESFLSFCVSITNIILLVAIGIVLLVGAIVLLPLLLAAFIVYGIIKILHLVAQKGKFTAQEAKESINGFFVRFSQGGRSIERYMYDRMIENAERNLIKKINSLPKGSMDIWYSPAAFWERFQDVKGPTALNVPDLVTSEFPIRYAENSAFVDANEQVKRTIKRGKHFITYCDYVKRTLLMDCFGIDEALIRTVPHTVNNLLPYIQFDEELSHRFAKTLDYTTEFSKTLLNSIFLRNKKVQKYIRGFRFQDVHYIFYSSQSRPHKNIKNLILAYEYLLRRKYCNIKLILTADIDEVTAMWDYIVEKRLQFDVISFYDVSVQELAALYRCADLVVNPTLYEGGFPFTFGEGMSVGTPSVMSDIPQVREVVVPFRLEKDMLFDPYDWKSMADKIEYALQNRDALYQKELSLYRELEKRTGSVVAEEYVHAFEYFIEQDKLAQKG